MWVKTKTDLFTMSMRILDEREATQRGTIRHQTLYTTVDKKRKEKQPDEFIDGCSGEHSLASIKSKIISFAIILPGDSTTVESVMVRAMKILFSKPYGRACSPSEQRFQGVKDSAIFLDRDVEEFYWTHVKVQN